MSTVKFYCIAKSSLLLLVIFFISGCVSGGQTGGKDGPENAIANPRFDAPIIFVHGFMGFDPDSEFGFPYWGGTIDLEEELREAGFEVYTAEVGPFSSNWDRACELYAFIKGGMVDYGIAHSHKYGHARYGEYYPGVFPEWGTYSEETGKLRKVHLIGHSMGGQTVRLLAELLAHGDSTEIAAVKATRIHREKLDWKSKNSEVYSELFSGENSWVASISTIATPHDGTTLTDRYSNLNLLHKLFAGIVAHSSLQKEDPLIELHLDHWGTFRKSNESFEQFVMRAIRKDLWKQTRDFSYYDLSLSGAKELNRQTTTQSDIYYFSWATSRTVVDEETGYYVPMRGMSLLLRPTARYMGSLLQLPDGIDGDPEIWWENDGMVNTCSMDGPSLGRNEEIYVFPGENEIRPGRWYFMGTLKPLDHFQVNLVLPISGDTPPGYDSLFDFYERWCAFLVRLPEVK